MNTVCLSPVKCRRAIDRVPGRVLTAEPLWEEVVDGIICSISQKTTPILKVKGLCNPR